MPSWLVIVLGVAAYTVLLHLAVRMAKRARRNSDIDEWIQEWKDYAKTVRELESEDEDEPPYIPWNDEHL